MRSGCYPPGAPFRGYGEALVCRPLDGGGRPTTAYLTIRGTLFSRLEKGLNGVILSIMGPFPKKGRASDAGRRFALAGADPDATALIEGKAVVTFVEDNDFERRFIP